MSNYKYILNDEAVCPYCDYKQSDSWEIAINTEGEWIETECGNCDKSFRMKRVVTVEYNTERIEETV